jgi:hypothetical protein
LENLKIYRIALYLFYAKIILHILNNISERIKSRKSKQNNQ